MPTFLRARPLAPCVCLSRIRQHTSPISTNLAHPTLSRLDSHVRSANDLIRIDPALAVYTGAPVGRVPPASSPRPPANPRSREDNQYRTQTPETKTEVSGKKTLCVPRTRRKKLKIQRQHRRPAGVTPKDKQPTAPHAERRAAPRNPTDPPRSRAGNRTGSAANLGAMPTAFASACPPIGSHASAVLRVST